MKDLPLIVFDVNETLLDLDTMTPIFERIFRQKEAMRLWFSNLILYSAALTLARSYVPFTDIGGAVLKMLAAARGITITPADERELRDKFSTMPPHPEVPAALTKLRTAGFRLFTLTDNLLEVQGRQLEQRHGPHVDVPLYDIPCRRHDWRLRRQLPPPLGVQQCERLFQLDRRRHQQDDLGRGRHADRGAFGERGAAGRD